MSTAGMFKMNYFRYNNQKCPVCENAFGENDDIVVCPICGTPHHRDCYKKNGECANTDRHNEGFCWTAKDTQAPESAAPSEAQNEQPVQPKITVETNFGNQPNPFNIFPSELDDGVTPQEAATFVQLNAFRYLDRFFHQKEGRNTWNWAAFLFTPYWFFCRKLHKIGAIFLALSLFVSIAFSFLPPAVRFTEDITEAYEQYLADNSDEATDKYIKDVQQAFKSNPAGITLSVVQFALTLTLRIIAGMFANKWYYKFTLQSINNVKAETADENRQKIMFFKRGGMAVGAPILAFMASGCVTMALGLLLQI